MIHKKWLVVLLCLYRLAGGTLASSVLKQTPPSTDVAVVNRIVNHTLEQFENQDFSKMPDAPYDYTVLDTAGNVLFQTSPQAPDIISEAVRSHDAVLDVTDIAKSLQPYGEIPISINYEPFFALQHRRLTKLVLLMSALLLSMAFCYTSYLNCVVSTLFQRLKDFAHHIVMGNLDTPLPMDKYRAFGIFTESFDIMREQLTEARQREAKASRNKKELVTFLSHDIKTPVISIKLISGLMLVTEQDIEVRGKIQTIYNKSEQTDRLITNAPQATLENLGELQVTLSGESSALLKPMTYHSDFYGRVIVGSIPSCLLLMGILRIEQVIDNVISNAYKYADTPIIIRSKTQNGFLRLEFMDYGDGVPEEELPKLLQKFHRGSNSQANSRNGSDLGLCIAHHLMHEMRGDIWYYNHPDGFSVEVLIRLAQFFT